MAYFVDHAQTGGTASISSVAMNMPAHQTNDILIAHIVVDTGTITTAGSSWAALPSAPSNPVTQGIVSYLLYVKAAGSSETLTLTTGDAYSCSVYCFRDVDGTTPFDGVTPKHAGVASTTSTPVNETIVTGTNDSLVVYLIGMDGTTPQVLTDPGVMFIYNADSTGTTATTSSQTSAAWYITRTAGTSPAANWSASITDDYVRATFVLRNTSGGRIPAYIDDSSSPGTRLTCGHHVATQSNISYSASGSYVVTANIASKTLTQTTAANGADFGINPYSNAVSSAAAQTATTALTGPELVLTSGRDLTNGLICGSFIAGTPKMGTFGVGSIAQGGIVVRVASGANNWNAYQVAAKDSVPNPEQRCVFAIKAGYDGSDYDTGSSGSATTTSVTYVQFLRNAPSFSSQVYTSELHQVFAQIVAGGDATTPVDTDGMAQIGQSFRLPVIQKSGSTGLVSLVPIQIGGGDAVNFQIDAGSLQFPRRASTTKKELQFHGPDNTLGISYAGKSGDVVKHTNSVVTSPTPYYWEIHTAATSAATWDFAGLVIVGANVTLRNVMTFDSMSFSSCPTLTFSSCTVTNSSISKIPNTNDTLTANSTTSITGTSISTTTLTTPGNRWVSLATADLDIFTSCTFTGTTTGGHAIRLTSTGTVSFTGNTFTGYGPAARSFNAATGVNTGTDVITLDAAHGYNNGEPAYFQDQGGTAPTGMTDGNLYYVRSESSTTITLYATAAQAIAGGSPGRVDITAAGSGTQYIYSGAAAIYNNSGGAITINVTNGSTPSIRNSDGSSTTINNNVTVTVTIKDTSGTAIPGVEVAIFQDNAARTVVLATTTTNANGEVSTSAAQSLGAIIIRARQSTNKASFLTNSSGIDASTEVITTLANHNFKDGDAAVYSKNGGSESIGLTAGTTYYVNNISATTLSLHDTAANAIADTSRKNLNTSGAETHVLDPIRYVPASATGTIGASAFSAQITMITDDIATG